MGLDKKVAYNSVEEYQKDLADWGRRWVDHYCRVAVDTSEQGEISLIRGKILFKRELAKLCENVFSEEEKRSYAEGVESFLEEMNRIHEKSRKAISQEEMITMEYLYHVFGFDDFEWYLFCMAYLPEIDEQFNRVFVLLQDDFEKKAPTIDMCIRMFTLDEEERYALKNKVLERWGFLSRFWEGQTKGLSSAGKKESVLSIPLYLDRRIVKFIYDMDSEDPVLEKVLTCYLPSDIDRHKMLIREKELETLIRMYQSAGRKGLVYLCGEQGIGKKFLVQQLGQRLNQPILMIDTKGFLELCHSYEGLAQRLEREVILKGRSIVCFADMPVNEEELDATVFEMLLQELEETALTPIITSGVKWKESIHTRGRRCMQMELPSLTMKERELLWREFMSQSALQGEVDIERLAGTYKLSSGSIERVVRETEVKMLIEKTEKSLEKALYEGCQKQLVHSLGKDAVRVPVQYTMEELVLPEAQKKLLTDACNMVKYHHHVFETWGFNKKMAYGKGVSMIFYGPPGTGKTMGAQAIANELNLELYRVDMASVLSKYVGESEKKLGNIFEQGQKSQSILFFDEADALFGKRSEVKDSQDKYANASTAFLLQKLEEYQGIIILATNLLQNFDQAFCRRFQFIVEFPFPDEKRRKEIWQRVFPQELPKDELDYDYLGEEFVLSGSQIKNIAVGAAFLAAGEMTSLKMVHILQTIKREMKKTGKNMIASDFGAYYSLMENEEGGI